MRAAAQYGVEKRIMDLCTFDVTHNPLRCGGFFDAIITDPPCKCASCVPMEDYMLIYRYCGCNTDGVRAGAKRLGRKPTDKKALKERDPEVEEAQKKGSEVPSSSTRFLISCKLSLSG